jgi:hypothetical protein
MDRNKIVNYLRSFDPENVKIKNRTNTTNIYVAGYKNGEQKLAADLKIAYRPGTSEVYLASGGTEPNFRKSNKKYGTFIRALATRAAIHGGAKKVTHRGSNKENLILRQVANKMGMSLNKARNLRFEGDKNFMSKVPVPISTKIVRNKLGFVHNNGKHPYDSVFRNNMPVGKLNKILNDWRA